MAKEKNPWLVSLKHIALASLADFGVYIPLALLTAAVFENSKLLRFMGAYVILAAFYAVFLYRFHMHPRISTYVTHGNVLDYKAELHGFLCADGKVLLTVYGILAVAHEISILALQGSPQNPVGLVCAFPLGAFWAEIPVPILRSVLAFVYASVVACGLALLRSRKIHKDDLAAEARRRER